MTDIDTGSLLSVKISHTAGLMKNIISEFDVSKVAVAWTGGKDSTLVLAIWREILKVERERSPLALSVDTGVKFPEVMAFRDHLALEWGVDLKVVRPEVDVDRYPVAENPVTCCTDLKIKPLQKAIADLGIQVLITGIRRDEHPSRAGRQEVEVRKNPCHTVLNPILEWVEVDIWSFTTAHMIPFNNLYEKGYRSIGCRPCTGLSGGGNERQGRNAEKENNLELLSSLGYF